MAERKIVVFVSMLVLASIADASSSKRRGARKPFDPAAVVAAANDPAAGSILRAQILLDRAGFSPGEIDGKQGVNLSGAISGFQEARRLNVSGNLDPATWQALNLDTVPAVAPYRITDADIAGPFADVPPDLMQQSKLKVLGFASPEEAIGEQFHVSPALLKRLNPNAAFSAGQEIRVPNILTEGVAPVKAAKVVVSKAGYVRALASDGAILAQYPSSSGSERDPLPVGEWKVTGVSRKPSFNYNPKLFWDADPAHSKAKIAAGPNNPVGSVWIDITKDHYGIHGTPEPNRVGHTQSHGCIRLTNWDAVELSTMVAPGVPVSLTE